MPTPVPTAEWHCKPIGAYARTSTEAFENAVCVYNLLSSLGWTIEAICAFWGNIEAESGYNPWRWENDDVPSSNESPSYGYGLVQFTPSSKYIQSDYAIVNTGFGPNYADWEGNKYDGDSQCRYVNDHADYIPNPLYNFQISYQEFKTGQYSTEFLAMAWLHNYERPQEQGPAVEQYRASIARYWYDILNGYDPTTPIPPEGGGGEPTPKPINSGASPTNKFNINFYLKPFYKRL